MAIHYHDLEIELDRCCCGQPEIRILESTYDRPRARFDFSDDRRAALESKVQKFEDLLLTGEEHASRRRQLAEEIGLELYRTLLPGPIGRTFERCHAALGDGAGLRLRLSFGRPYDRQLGGLPWELLCEPEKRRFVGIERESPVVRYLDLGEKIEPLDVRPPLRVLAAIASPDPETSTRYEYSRIDPHLHSQILREAMPAGTHLRLQILNEKKQSVTLAALHEELTKAELADKPYHALHFLGHGGFNEDGEGALFFEREDGRDEHLVTGADLARQLTKDVRLVVLASCGTGKIPLVRRNGEHPFAGVASALVAAGKPAVVAMQFNVSEAAVGAFAKAFYGAIQANQEIDVAVTEGRLLIDAHGEEGGLEWATPVLFLRSPDGRILNLCRGVPPETVVAIYHVLEKGKEKMEYVDYEVDLRRYFVDRFIDAPRDWNGAIMDDLRCTLCETVPRESPVHLEIAAPLSVAFACGFLLPVNERRAITVGQRGETWRFDDEPRLYAPPWLGEAAARARIPSDFPFDKDATDIAAVIGVSQLALDDVAAYLRRRDLDPSLPSHPPRIRDLVYACFEDADSFVIRDGGHARRLATKLVERINELARPLGYPTTHIFLAGPQGLALALGRECHLFPRIQLYEFDKGKKRHGTYEP